ncbi:MAG TPA: 6-carboxytetrahydropterin synthase [Candidatus Sulfotelmatobacter sp.]|jgi:6-pyruvoyltetrahydropterin/6-carboxytetrahydropterin synthase|nr:6-carboxytetrahydropterin synthase [Candidatus Sulfotelmatobacter sp.]
MLIRKLFKFESAHVVRNCTTRRCSRSLHGHSYRVELLFTAKKLDNAGMIMDFGLLKGAVKELIDSWDHAACFWDKDTSEYVQLIQQHSERWVSMPVNPSAEQFSRVFFVLVDRVLSATSFANGEDGVQLDSVIVHETDSGYAQCWRQDAYDVHFGGLIDLRRLSFSNRVREEWSDPMWWDKLIASQGNGQPIFLHSSPPQQIS